MSRSTTPQDFTQSQMGSSLASRIKAAVISYDAESLRQLLKNETVRECDGVNMPLNRKRDSALSLAIRLARYELISIIIEAGAQVFNRLQISCVHRFFDIEQLISFLCTS